MRRLLGGRLVGYFGWAVPKLLTDLCGHCGDAAAPQDRGHRQIDAGLIVDPVPQLDCHQRIEAEFQQGPVGLQALRVGAE